jgi:hypothetical protein
MTNDSAQFLKALNLLEAWLVRNHYTGYDPFDGLASFLRPLTLRKRFLEQVLLQGIRRIPWNLRPVVGIKPHTSPIGMGYLASAYLKLYSLTKDERYRRNAVSGFEWLINNHSTGYSGYCWGNDFDYTSRGGYLPKGAPTVVWCSLIGHNFIEGFRLLNEEKYLGIAKSVGDFICTDLPRSSGPGGVCISYVCDAQLSIHNSNLLAAGFLAELHKETGHGEYLALATDAVRYSAGAQLENGAWYYGEEEKFHWIDNWHTAYDLDSLLEFQRNSGSHEFDMQMLKGLDFYVRHFFRPDGAPKYYWDRDYRFDIQSASQSIDTLLHFATHLTRSDLIELAKKVAGWTIVNMQDKEGFFYLWKSKWLLNRTPTFHWGGTTMFHALAHLLLTTDTSRGPHNTPAGS